LTFISAQLKRKWTEDKEAKETSLFKLETAVQQKETEDGKFKAGELRKAVYFPTRHAVGG
jgi:hypothetical protein